MVDMANRDVREIGGAWARFQHHSYPPPPPDLAPFVSHFWLVRWDLRGEEPYRQLIVPSPNVQLSFVNGYGAVHGLSRRHGVKVLAGQGRAFGVAFRPGGFRPFLGSSVSTITDRSIPATELFADVPDEAMAAVADEQAQVRIVAAFLRAHLPEHDPAAELAADIVAAIAADPELVRVDDVAERFGTHVRTLQRLFAEYVGVGPKWVVRRFRLAEVTDRMARSEVVDWAGVAAELGYADQAHLTRDFTSMVGESPTRYAERYPTPRSLVT
jgi:AraC-like DNA-binding protein